MRIHRLAVLVSIASAALARAVSAATIDRAAVGDTGNACNTQSQGWLRAVDSEYQLVRYEVTDTQYANFLWLIASGLIGLIVFGGRKGRPAVRRSSLLPRRLTMLSRSARLSLAIGGALCIAAPAAGVTLSAGDIVVADGLNGEIVRVAPGGARTTVANVLAQGIAIEVTGNLVLSTGGTVSRLDPDTGQLSEIFNDFAAGRSFGAVTLGEDGTIYAIGNNVNINFAPALYKIDPLTGAGTVISVGGSLDFIRAIAVEASGDVIAVGPAGVLRVDPSTGAQAFISSGGEFTGDVGGVAIDAGGDIFITAFQTAGGEAGIFRIDPVTGAQSIVSGGGNLRLPRGIGLQADGNLVVADPLAFNEFGAVIRVDPLTGAQSTVAAGAFEFDFDPGPLAVVAEPELSVLLALGLLGLAFAGRRRPSKT